MKAVLLAAGFATRLYPMTKEQAKPLLKIAGKPMIEYILAEIEKINRLEKIYIITNGRFYEDFLNWQQNYKSTIPIEVVSDHTQTVDDRLGAIGDMAYIIEQKKITGPLLVMAGDNIFTYSMEGFYNFFKEKNKDVTVGKIIEDREILKSMAVADIDGTGKIIKLREKPKVVEGKLGVYAGYFFTADTLPLILHYATYKEKTDAPGYFLEWLYEQKDVFLYEMEGECYDIGTPAAYAWADEHFVALYESRNKKQM